MKRIVRIGLALLLLAAVSTVWGRGESAIVPLSHQDQFDCSVYYQDNYAIAAASYNIADGNVVHTWWIGDRLTHGRSKTKSYSGSKITVKIRVRTPYNTYLTLASETCSSD